MKHLFSPTPRLSQSSLKSSTRLMLGASGLVCAALATPAFASGATVSADFGSLAARALAPSSAASTNHAPAAPAAAISSASFAPVHNTIAPVLSFGLVDFDSTVQRGTAARFLGFTNYPAFAVKSELRLYSADQDVSTPPHAIIPANKDGVMIWTPTNYAEERMKAVYRVYDADGNFDETQVQYLDVVPAGRVMQPQGNARPDFGIVDSAATRSIPLDKAQSAVISGLAGRGVERVRIAGQLVAHDATSGDFSSAQLIPAACVQIPVTAEKVCGTNTVVHATKQAQQAISGQPGNGLNITVLDPDQAEDTPQLEERGINPDTTNGTENYQIEVRSDERKLEPVLAIGMVESERLVARGDQVTFIGYNNYPALIARQEVRIFEAGVSMTSVPLAALDLDDSGFARWSVGAEMPDQLVYVLRAYDADGRFDETAPQELVALDELKDDQTSPSRPNFGQHDEAVIRTIKMRRVATVTVTGRADPDAEIVRVGGQFVPVDAEGKFVSEQIVPDDTKDISIMIGKGEEIRFAAVRDLNFERERWFVVAQGEVTIGRSFSSGPAEIVSGSTLADGDYAIGRTAFYAKGPIGGDWKLTTALDTGEAPLEDLFSNLDRKDPRQLLRRLNSEQYYPTYGDDSTLVEDAPTQGRFYLRADNGTSQAVIGNFIAEVTSTELAQLDRGLFGALVDINSAGTTDFGERDAQVIAFASDPGTVPAREEFRGTGGSLYFLERQDVSIGSERVRVEIRDRETGLVLETRELHPREDYDFDPFNGRLTLLRPLPTTVSTGRTIREGSLAGNVPVLVVRYEYTPAVGDIDGYTVGGRGTVWIGDTLRLGVTAQKDSTADVDQTLLGADAIVRITAGTYVKAELAQTDGAGFAQSNSIDGGLSFNDFAAPIVADEAYAWRAEGAINFAELANKQGDLGKVSAFYEQLDRGFSSAGRLTIEDTERWGAAIELPLGKNGAIAASFDQVAIENRGTNRTGEVDVSKGFTLSGGTLKASAGVRHEDLAPATLFNSSQNGERTDAGVELEFQPAGSSWTLHGFGQASLSRDDTRASNNRIGAGATAQITDRLSFKGELSGGDGGFGADVMLNHRMGEGAESYVGYRLLADRTDTGLEPENLFTDNQGGALVVGSRQRFTDSLSVFGENRIGIGGDASTLARSFGLTFTPSEQVSVSGTFENGRVDDPSTGPFERTAGSVSVGYTTDAVRAGAAVEIRDEGNGTGDQTVWLIRSNLSYAVNPDWRFVSQLNLARADTEGTSIRAAEFTEAIAGFAFRPVENERVNGLIRLQYFEDLGPVGQFTGSGQTESPKQVSTIFSADFNFDLSEKLTLGTRYGYRGGKVSLGRNSEEFVSSDAHLAVLRADYNVLKQWDLLVEGRALWVTQADDLRLGALAGAYRHIGDNVKIGLGYSWSDFSDDLTDQSYSSHGPFLNILGRF
ncbi:hypothetical protein FGU71_08800 [Erythrobacter insulae]|uniref:Uncharacterized protein n=1 Tax=Erythrobacter insulae TaxID=2584124 RepID=A0A547PCS1_9SPHN|nr:hypothetical protein [Erythrobacter insulae]TRD11943.1 hypothetical protein FGU71_08800 [Erythrobacter insulae]